MTYNIQIWMNQYDQMSRFYDSWSDDDAIIDESYILDEETFECDTCVICIEKLNNRNRSICRCGHQFHLTCIIEWINVSSKKLCPLCNDPIWEK